MCPKLCSRETLRFKGNTTSSFPKGEVIKCYVIYPIQSMNNLAASFSKKVFLLYKLFNYFRPSDIPSNYENNKFNQDIQQLFPVLVPGVVLQFQVSQYTAHDLVAFQVHPADLRRRFQLLSSLTQQQKPLGHRVQLDKKVKKQKLSFQTDFFCNIKMKKFLFTTSVSLLHLQNAACLCGWK